MENIKGLVKELSERDEVEAIVLGGSRATGKNDKDSDYDVYVYLSEEMDPEVRKNILQIYCNYIELNNTYWEAEDDCTLNDGTVIELIYRNLDQFNGMIDNIIIKGNASNGYTTCMWHNLLTGKILFDRRDEYSKMQSKYSIPYPKLLKDNIIQKNFELLKGYIPSYDAQLLKACKREDIVSVNHRITEFLASYFDIIFAVNELPHPGEKRLLSLCTQNCRQLPEHFIENIEGLIRSVADTSKTDYYLTGILAEMEWFLGK
jgi:predicted nucleotidyltransferase